MPSLEEVSQISLSILHRIIRIQCKSCLKLLFSSHYSNLSRSITTVVAKFQLASKMFVEPSKEPSKALLQFSTFIPTITKTISETTFNLCWSHHITCCKWQFHIFCWNTLRSKNQYWVDCPVCLRIWHKRIISVSCFQQKSWNFTRAMLQKSSHFSYAISSPISEMHWRNQMVNLSMILPGMHIKYNSKYWYYYWRNRK